MQVLIRTSDRFTYNFRVKTYFLSDLHLTLERPEITEAFFAFLRGDALQAQRIYILGDLFEVWIGDDAASILGADPILDAMAEVAKKVECYFIAGNRDFLVRNEFSKRSGFTVLKDETVIDLYGTRTLLLHGDSMCTDDVKHQKFRKYVTTNKWVSAFILSWSINRRLKKATDARKASAKNKRSMNSEIMDVTEQTVLDTFAKYDVTQMIHGHTHRQHLHIYGKQAERLKRYVLGDWVTSTSILKANKQGLFIENTEIKTR